MFRSILVPTDFEASASEAFRVARDRFPGAAITLLHVVLPRRVGSAVEESHAVLHALEVRKKLETESRERLGAAARAGERVEVAVGDPAERILEHARLAGADLIVMGTHARSGVALFLNGSVATEVVRRARLPVLIVHEGDAGRA